MVFAFLPTALLYLCSGAGAILSIVLLCISPSSAALLCSVLFVCSAAGILLSYVLSEKLDDMSEEGFLTDFDRTYRAALGRSRRCFGTYRIVSLLDTAYYCCAYERLNEARDVLLRAKPLIEKNGSSPCRAAYLLLVLEYRKKSKDMNGIGAIIAQAADSISSSRYVTRSGRKNAEQALVYSAAELELYSRTAEELASSRRDVTDKMYRLSAEVMRSPAKGGTYKKFCAVYDHALVCILSGRNEEAQRCLSALAGSLCPFPLRLRAQRYLDSGNIQVLMEKTP